MPEDCAAGFASCEVEAVEEEGATDGASADEPGDKDFRSRCSDDCDGLDDGDDDKDARRGTNSVKLLADAESGRRAGEP